MWEQVFLKSQLKTDNGIEISAAFFHNQIRNLKEIQEHSKRVFPEYFLNFSKTRNKIWRKTLQVQVS